MVDDSVIVDEAGGSEQVDDGGIVGVNVVDDEV